MPPSKKQQKNQPQISKKKQLDDDLSFLDEQIKQKANISDSDKIFLEFQKEKDEVLQSKKELTNKKLLEFSTQMPKKINKVNDVLKKNVTDWSPIIQNIDTIYKKCLQYGFQELEELKEQYNDSIMRSRMPFLFDNKFSLAGKIFRCIEILPIKDENDMICLNKLIDSCGDQYPSLIAMIYLLKGVLHKTLGQFDEEIKCYEKILEVKKELNISPFKPEEDTKNKFQKLFNEYNPEYQKAFKHLLTTYTFKGEVASNSKKYEDAISWYEKALSLYDKKMPLINTAFELYVQVLESKAKVLYQLDRFQDSLNSFNELLLETALFDPNRAVCLFLSGDCLYQLDKYSEALGFFEKALALTSDQKLKAEILFKMGSAYKEINQNDKALEYVDLAKDGGYVNPNLYYDYSVIFFKTGLYQEALENINKAIENGFDNFRADFLKANILLFSCKYENAVSEFEKILNKADASDDYLKESGFSKSPIHSNLAETFRRMGQYTKALESYKEAIKLDSKNLNAYAGVIELCDDIGIDCGDLYNKLANFHQEKAIDLSFLDSHEIKDKIEEASKKEDKIEDVAEKKLANEDDVDYLAANVSKYQRVEKLVLDYLSLDEATKEQKKAAINEMIAQDKSLEGFVVRLFASQDGQQGKITEIFAADRPGLIHKFFQHKKGGADIKKQQANTQQKEIVISAELEGVHKIKSDDNFKASWFFKFTKEIIAKFGSCLLQIKDKINDLRIIKEGAQGQVGFKKHEVKIEGGEKFSMLKLAGLGEDKEVYSKKIYKYYDSLTQKTSILSIFDSCDGHKDLNDVINLKNSHGFEHHDVASYQDFEALLLG